MVTHFITASNGIITGQHAGDINADFFGTPYYGHERIVIPEGVMVREFDKLDFYDKKWNRKSDCCLIKEGLLPMPEGYVQEGETLRLMTRDERIEAGIDVPPEGYISPADMERIIAGELPPPDGYRVIGGRVEKLPDYEQHATAELNRRLMELQTPVAQAKAEIDPKYAAERKAKIAALLAVRDQPGWPAELTWPPEAE